MFLLPHIEVTVLMVLLNIPCDNCKEKGITSDALAPQSTCPRCNGQVEPDRGPKVLYNHNFSDTING